MHMLFRKQAMLMSHTFISRLFLLERSFSVRGWFCLFIKTVLQSTSAGVLLFFFSNWEMCRQFNVFKWVLFTGKVVYLEKISLVYIKLLLPCHRSERVSNTLEFRCHRPSNYFLKGQDCYHNSYFTAVFLCWVTEHWWKFPRFHKKETFDIDNDQNDVNFNAAFQCKI